MADPMMPDLTGLSEEERKIIEEVLARQKAEEQKEEQLTQVADKELEDIDRQLSSRKDAAAKLIGTQDDAICQICQKTKFADGIGHKCFYCQLRSCARCGGRTTSKNKNIWACSLCQKRQQILAKTGKWFQNAADQKPSSGPNSQYDLASQANGMSSTSMDPMTLIPNGHPPGQNNTMNIGQQQAQPQYQQQMPAVHMNNQMPPQQYPQQQPQIMPVQQPPPHYQQHQQQQQQQLPPQQPPQQKESVVGGLMGMIGLKSNSQPPQQPKIQQPAQPIAPMNGQLQQQQQNYPNQAQMPLQNAQQPTARRQNTLHRQPSLERSEYQNGNGTRRQSSKYDEHYMEADTSQRRYEDERTRKTRADAYIESPGNSIRGSKDEYYDDRGVRRKPSDVARRRDGQQIYEDDPSFKREGGRRRDQERPPHVDRPPIDPRRQQQQQNQAKKPVKDKKIDVHPLQPPQQSIPPAVPPPEKAIGFSTPTMLKPLPSNRHRKKLQSRSSLKEGTSSEEEAPQGNTETEKNDFTEKDLLLYIYGSTKKMGPEMAKFDMSLKSKSNLDLATTARGSVLPGNSLASKIRKYLSSPVSWQPAADQKRLIGHMVLQRLQNDGGDLGLKVAGGRSTVTGRIGTFVTKVRPGSVADIVGQLRPGDEVLEWNGQILQNASIEQVRNIVSSSKNDPQVELIVSRNLANGTDDLHLRRSATGLGEYTDMLDVGGSRRLPMMAGPTTSSSLSPLVRNQLGTCNIPRIRHTSVGPSLGGQYSVPEMAFPGSSQVLIGQQHSPLGMASAEQSGQFQIYGRIEISLLYLPRERELVVTVLGASDLPPRRDGTMRNLYAKLFLLPDRSERSLRQTTVHGETLSTVWNESFYYRNLTEPVLMSRILEVTVWDYDKYEANTFLGEVLIDFSTSLLDNRPFVYDLVELDDDHPIRMRLRNMRRFSSVTPPPRPFSETAQYQYEAPFRSAREPYRERGARMDDEYELDEMGYPRMPRSRTYDRSGAVAIDRQSGAVVGGPVPANAYRDWNINSPQNMMNGYVSDHNFAQQQPGYYANRRPRSATAMREDEMMAQPRYQRRQRTRHSQDPSMRPISPYMQEDPAALHQQQRRGERPPPSRRYELPQEGPELPGTQIPSIPPHMQYHSGVSGEYGSDGSETMSVNSAQSMQNRQIRQQQQQQLPASSEDGECSSNSLRQQNFINDEFNQSQSMEEANQSDSASKNNQSMKELKERKKSLMTRFIPGRGPGGSGDKRTGFIRSEEVGITEEIASKLMFQKQASRESTDSDNWNNQGTLNDAQLGTFVENLGLGQVVGRQALASPVLGEIELCIDLSRGDVKINVIRAKKLSIRPGVKGTPAPYVSCQLMEGKVCHSKAKTAAERKTTAPVFNQQIEFSESYKHRELQVTVLGDCNRMERKLFMGIAQIRLDELAALKQPVQSWYKLYHNSSLTGVAPVRKDSENSLFGGQN